MCDLTSDFVFSFLIVIIMLFAFLNGREMKIITEEMKKLQEYNLKVAVHPNIKLLLYNINNLLSGVKFFDGEKSFENINPILGEIRQLEFYFDPKDEIYVSIKNLEKRLMVLIENISHREVLRPPGGKIDKNDMPEYMRWSKNISTEVKIIADEIYNINKSIINKFRIVIKTTDHNST